MWIKINALRTLPFTWIIRRYYEDITAVYDKHGIKRHHSFADDKQLLTSVIVTDVSVAKSNSEACVTDVQAWCASRRLQLNPSKTDVIWLGTRYRLQQLAGLTST